MNKNKKLFLLLAALLSIIIPNNLFSKDYYFSKNGNDNADGLSPNTSFQSINKLNGMKLNPGDRVFFKSGDRFTGTIHLKYSGELNNPIIFTTYGGDKKAVLSGSKHITGIKSLGNNLYVAPCKYDTEYFFLDGDLLIIAREPNKGFFTMNGGGKDHLIDADLKLSKDEIIGSNVRIRTTNWSYEYRKAVDFKESRIFFDSILYNTSFNYYTCKKGFGYYLDNQKAFLDADHESYRSDKEKKVYFISSRYKKNSRLQGGVIENGVIIENGIANIHIEGIALDGFIEFGIHAKGNNKNITVNNCDIFNIIKTGFSAEKGCDSIIITNNRISDITGTAIRLKAPGHSIIENNKIKRIGLIAGYGIDGNNGAIGISVENLEKLGLPPEEVSNNNLIRNNLVDSTGYMSVRMDGYNNIFEKNIVKNGLLTMNDGGLIHTYGADSTSGMNLSYTHSSIIKDNFFINCYGNTESSSNDHKMINGIYLDARSNNFTIENNVVINCGGGILLNDKTRDCKVQNNTLYANGQNALNIVQSNQFDSLNHWVTNNILFNTTNRKSSLSLTNNRGTYISPGYIDSNIYASPNEVFHIKRIIVNDKKWKNTREYTLDGWKAEFDFGQNSMYWSKRNEGKEYPKSQIFINESNKPKKVKLNPGFEYLDMNGQIINNDFTLQPRGSKILMYRIK